jgi:hypothetical protein
MRNTKGITLIALVITIIILLILAGVSLSARIGENGILTKAKSASITQKFATYKEATEMALDSTLTLAGEEIKEYLPSITSEDLENFAIVNGSLVYLGNNEEEINVANNLGIDTTMSENASVSDIITIKNQVFTLEVTLPQDDTQDTPSELLGTRLYDKNALNGERWNLVITYDSNNNEKERYGSGYYYLTSENCGSLGLTGNYLINYETKQLIGLSNYRNWNLSSTLAVTDGLVLNIDPTNLADGNWMDITKHGDVSYSATDKALLFNESESNTAGEGGYLELTRSGVDFSNGFTFEIYANLSRTLYANSSGSRGLGLFCRIPTLNSNYTQSIRFGYAESSSNSGVLCKFNSNSSWYSTGVGLWTHPAGSVLSSSCGYDVNEDFYLTFVYIAYDSSKDSEYQTNHYDEYMIENNVDKIEYYINGILYGYTYYGHNSYQNGLNTWNNDSCPFFLGVCPWGGNGNLYYLKGKVYSTRLYTTPMTAEQASENRDATMQYRASF